DAFVAAFPPDGAGPLYSTYLGGSNDDNGRAIYADGAGNTYVGGYASSANFPTTANAYQLTKRGYSDGFLSKLFFVAQPTPTGTPPTATPRPPTRTDTPTVTNTPNPCGLNWNIVPSPNNSTFEDISVLSANDIWAVGYV